MSQTKAQLISDLVQALAFTATASAPTNGMFLSATNTLAISTDSSTRLTVDSDGRLGVGLTPSSTASITNVAAGLIQTDGNIDIRYPGTNSDPAGTRYLSFVNTDSTLVADQPMGGIRWVGNDTSNTSRDSASILAINDGNAGLASHITFNNDGGTERMRIDSDGRLLVGTTSALDTVAVIPKVQSADAGNEAGFGAFRYSNNAPGPIVHLFKSRGTSVGTNTVVQSGDTLGEIRFAGADGTNEILGAQIVAQVNGTPGTDDMPGALLFSTTADGASTPTERMRIDSSGNVGIGTTSPVSDAVLTLSTDSDTALFFRRGAGTNQDGAIRFESGAFQFLNGANSSTVSGLSERMRIDSSGRLLIGINTSQNVGFAHAVQIEGTTGATSGLSLIRNSNDTNAPHIDFAKTRGTATGSNTVVQSGDDLGNLVFRGADGTDKGSIAVQIQAEVDGTPGSNDMPGRLLFMTTADGASSPTERMRIDNAGRVGIGTSSIDSNAQVHICQDSTPTGGDINLNAAGLVVDNSAGNTGLTFKTPNTSSSRVCFGDPQDNNVGQILYHHNDNRLSISTAGEEQVRIDSDGRLLVGTTSDFTNGSGTKLQTVDTSGGQIALGRDASTLASGSLVGRIRWWGNVGGTEEEVARISVEADDTHALNDKAGRLRFMTNGGGASVVERMRIDSSGRIGIGNSSPSSTVNIGGDAITTVTPTVCIFPSSGSGIVTIRGGEPTLSFDQTGGNDQRIIYDDSSDLIFQNGTLDSVTERVRFFDSGQTHHFSSQGVMFAGTSQGAGTTYWLFRGNRNRVTNTSGGTTVFYVWSNGNVQNTNNSYSAISDVKLKENIVDATSQWDDLKAIQVRKYNFIEGETHTQLGVIAQEIETVSPGLVNDIVDRDEEGNDLGTITKSVNYSVLYMKAVKALQEAMERIETLEAKVAALEAE